LPDLPDAHRASVLEPPHRSTHTMTAKDGCMHRNHIPAERWLLVNFRWIQFCFLTA